MGNNNGILTLARGSRSVPARDVFAYYPTFLSYCTYSLCSKLAKTVRDSTENTLNLRERGYRFLCNVLLRPDSTQRGIVTGRLLRDFLRLQQSLSEVVQ